MNHHLISNFTQTTAMTSNRVYSAAYSQASTTGACHNFTIEWISLMFSSALNTTSAQRMAKLAVKRGTGNSVLQKVFVERWLEGGDSFRIADKMMISLRGLKEDSLPFNYSNFDQSKLVDNIEKPSSSGIIYSFWFSGGAHTIGFFRNTQAKRGKLSTSDGYVSAFDPNYGEYHIPENDFDDWFNRLKLVYGGNITHHALKFVSKK